MMFYQFISVCGTALQSFFRCGYLGNGTIRIDASSACQLECPVCTEKWRVRAGVGTGVLKFEDFKKFVDRYPHLKEVELSNNGEIFLNPEINDIIQYAY